MKSAFAASHQISPCQMGTNKWPVNKNLHTKELLPYCSLDSTIPRGTPSNKGNMVEKKAMTALSHPSLSLTHTHPSQPAGLRSKQLLGCDLSQVLRR